MSPVVIRLHSSPRSMTLPVVPGARRAMMSESMPGAMRTWRELLVLRVTKVVDTEDGVEGSSVGVGAAEEGSAGREGVEASRVSGSKRVGRVIGFFREEPYRKRVVQMVQPIRM